MQAASRWHYIKFELKDPANPGTITPTLGGSVGFYPACGISDNISGSGTSVLPITLSVQTPLHLVEIYG